MVFVKCLPPGAKDDRRYSSGDGIWPYSMRATPRVGDLVESRDGRLVRQVSEVVHCEYRDWNETYVRLILVKPRMVRLTRFILGALGMV